VFVVIRIEVLKIIAKACIKCQEFIMIHPNNLVSQQIEKEFEIKHSQHTMVCMDLDEIKGIYHKYGTADS